MNDQEIKVVENVYYKLLLTGPNISFHEHNKILESLRELLGKNVNI